MARKKQTYEEMIERIEEIAACLESGEASLEKAVELYKEGMELALLCRQKLDTAQKDVMTLKKQFDGSFAQCGFDSSEEVL